MNKKLDVLFVIPTNVPDFAVGSVPDAIEPPAKARFMASYLMRRKRSVDLFDSNILDYTPEEMAWAVVAANPHLVSIPVYGFNPSASTQTMPSARKFAQAIKNIAPHLPIIFSGTHPGAIPATTLNTEPAVDFVCSGEGPITVDELLKVIKTGSRSEDITKVRSLWHRKNGKPVGNAPAPNLDLNEEPVSREAWWLMDPRKYVAHHWHAFYQGMDKRMPYANSYSREGCPFHCNFCNIQATYRDGEQLQQNPKLNSFRDLSPELFLEEVTFLVETFGVTNFKLPDEMFGYGSHPIRIAKLVKERFGDRLNFWCYYRIDTCLPQYLELLRSAGFRWLGLGIEAANSTVRSGQDKKFGDEKIYQVVERLHAAGIEGGLNYIFGLPGDTMETMQATYDLACELNGAYGNFYCAQALPGSELYREAQQDGYPLSERPGGPGWMGYAQYSYGSEPYFKGDALTPAQILKFRDEKHIAYYSRPEYRAKLLNDPKFGQTALTTIDEWLLAIAPDKLKRRIIEEAARKKYILIAH